MNRRNLFKFLAAGSIVAALPGIDEPKMKLMINPETMAKAADIPNWGTLDGLSIMDKWLLEKRAVISES